MVTIDDVAKCAGVSKATVSRVLNNADTVSDKRRELVMDAIKRLKYEPNIAGRMLRKSETKSILVVFSVLIPEFMNAVTAEADKAGYTILFYYSPAYIKNAKPLSPVYQGLVDGVILQDVMLDQKVLYDIMERYPVVLCGGVMSFEGKDENSIAIDNAVVAYNMTKHLIEKGKKRIGFVGIQLGGKVEPKFSRDREIGVRKALAEAGIDMIDSLKYIGDVGYSTGREAADYYMSLSQMPDAVFCFNDKIAIGCISAFKEKGLRVPEDIYVAGFDNLGITAQFDPTISTVAQPFNEMGELAVRRILSEIQGELPEEVKIEGRIILRKSTGEED